MTESFSTTNAAITIATAHNGRLGWRVVLVLEPHEAVQAGEGVSRDFAVEEVDQLIAALRLAQADVVEQIRAGHRGSH